MWPLFVSFRLTRLLARTCTFWCACVRVCVCVRGVCVCVPACVHVCVRVCDSYLVGSAVTLADIAVFLALEQRGIAAAGGELAASAPHVVRWHAHCRSIKAFAASLTAVRCWLP